MCSAPRNRKSASTGRGGASRPAGSRLAGSRLAGEPTVAQRLARERGTVYKEPGGRLRWALDHPNTYSVGMSSLAIQSLYGLLNAMPDVVCERAFLPEPTEVRHLRHSGAPLVSLESQTPLRDFDTVGFSVSFELDYGHVAQILELGGIPARAGDRGPRDPLIIAGGVCPSYNPEPLADLVDAFVIGESETALAALTTALIEGTSRADRLARLGEIPGVYLPSRYQVEYLDDGRVGAITPDSGAPPFVERLWTPDLDAWPTHTFVTTPDTEFGNMYLVEVVRGCGRGCRFCVADFCYRPPRRRSAARILSMVEEGLRHREVIGLVGATPSDHPQVLDICSGILDRGGRFSLSSVRADTLSQELLSLIVRGGERTVTLAPETGSERLRAVTHKSLSDDQLLQAARWATEAGLRALKLYFMIGLPGETDDDITGIGDLLRRLSSEARPDRTALSVNPFIPKPGTPFQWLGMASPATLRRRWTRLSHDLAGETDLGGESLNWSLMQAALSRGDRRLGPVIIEATRAGGGLGAWRRAFADAGLDPEWYACRERDRDEVLPWALIGASGNEAALWSEKEAAMRIAHG